MKSHDFWKLSLRNVFSSPLRSALTVLGMAVGVGAILAVITLGEAGRLQVRSEMGRLGIDKIWLSGSAGTILQRQDAKLIADQLDLRAAEAAYLTAEIRCEWGMDTAAVIGCTSDYLDLNDIGLADGRMLWPLEWDQTGRNVLLGETLARKWKIDVGDRLYMNGVPMIVRGLVRPSDSFARVDAGAAILLPLQFFCAMCGDVVHEVVLESPADSQPQETAELAKKLLAQQRGVETETLTLQVQMEAADSVVTTFVDVLKWVAFICMLVGGIGVMNILLVGVRERRREIGIMKSLGATTGQICRLFLLEALLYASCGGAAGIIAGHVLILLAGWSIGLDAAAQLPDCFRVFVAALVIGLLFGVVPAAKAASLSCVEALREE